MFCKIVKLSPFVLLPKKQPTEPEILMFYCCTTHLLDDDSSDHLSPRPSWKQTTTTIIIREKKTAFNKEICWTLYRQQTGEPSSCSVCKEDLRDPVHFHCGHSSCKQCVSSDWDQSEPPADYYCPQCGKKFKNGDKNEDTGTFNYWLRTDLCYSISRMSYLWFSFHFTSANDLTDDFFPSTHLWLQ